MTLAFVDATQEQRTGQRDILGCDMSSDRGVVKSRPSDKLGITKSATTNWWCSVFDLFGLHIERSCIWPA